MLKLRLLKFIFRVCLVFIIWIDFKEYVIGKIYYYIFFYWGVEYVIGIVFFVGDRGVVFDFWGVVDDSADGFFFRGRYSFGIYSEFCGRI